MSERPKDAPPGRFPYPVAVLALALVVFATWARFTLPAAVGSYVVAVLLLNLASRGGVVPPVRGRPAMLLLAVLAVAPVATTWRRLPELWRDAGLRGVVATTRHRLALTRTPALFPRVVAGDHPQRFYSYAPGAASAALTFGPRATQVEGVGLGHGVFRFEYDPARDGAPASASGPFDATLSIDGATYRRELEATLRTRRPGAMASHPARGLAAAVSEETDEVILVEATGTTEVVRVGDGPSHLAFVDDGRLIAVAHRFSPDLALVSVERRAVERWLPLGAPGMVRVASSPDGATLAIAVATAEPGIELVDAAAGRALTSIRLGFRPDLVAFGAGADDLVVSWREKKTLYRLRRSDDDAAGLELPRRSGSGPSGWRLDPSSVALGRPAIALHRRRDGSSLVLASTGRTDDGSEAPGNHFVEHRIVVVDTRQWRVSGDAVTGRFSGDQDRASATESGAGPVAFAERDDGQLLVAFSGSDEVWLLADLGAQPTATTRVGSDLSAPLGLASLGGGRWAVASPSSGALGVFDAEGTRIALAQMGPSDADLERSDRTAWLRRQGERAFYEATRSGVACHSCHVFGDSDYSKHNIGQPTLLPTLSTFGVAGTSPYLRDASYPRVRDLMQVAEEVYRGFRKPAKANRGESLEAFVESLPPLPRPHARDEDLSRLRAGMDALFAAGCPLCHAPPAFTNLGQVPAKTAFPEYAAQIGDGHSLDVPTLVGLATSAPYLHDGRAQRVEDVLVEHNPSNRHGDVARLGADERAALAYLLERL